MNHAEILERLNASGRYQRGARFGTQDLVNICKRKITTAQARAFFLQLERAGVVAKVADAAWQKSNGTAADKIAKGPWRTLSNEALGIVPTRLGLL